jgi:hypothetical protein
MLLLVDLHQSFSWFTGASLMAAELGRIRLTNTFAQHLERVLQERGESLDKGTRCTTSAIPN